MILIISSILLCLVCGAFSYAGFYAYLEREPDSFSSSRENMGVAFLAGLFCTLLGPAGLLCALGCTGFFQHGLKWR